MARRTRTNCDHRLHSLVFLISCLLFIFSYSFAFQSDELLQDDEEFGIEGGRTTQSSLDLDYVNPIRTSSTPTVKKRSSLSSDHDSDSKVYFVLEHAFGDSDFVPAGTFSARLKTWNHGGQSLTKLRFSREALTELEKEKFQQLLKDDDFYRIRLPSNVLSPPGKDYVISSVKSRCLSRDSLDEHFVIYTEGVNILGVNYGSPGVCPYPRPLRLPKKWAFNSYTILKSSEQAPRAPAFTEDILNGDTVEGEMVNPPERSFWAKYWMYLIPLGLIVMNAITQAMNLPEEQAAGQPASQTQQTAAVRRR
ncbi:Er membrane protein complex subunit-like protein [Thalictrum thalictroides]|uniref:ER membrane protein complex subunit 10 n=1 Tax=Thalictrum thalictroides TaxID=46969 RepID=A0A7J6X7W0_THATH|nr:Er membrane protein complex subunit-like protein [Thalictrum thalictroides]